MTTKCTVIGENPIEEKEKKITFTYNVAVFNKLQISEAEPTEFRNIELMAKNYLEGLDLMFAYNEERHNGLLYLGEWNDGLV